MRPARRRLPRVAAAIATTGLAATGLAGCQLFEIQEPEHVPSAIESCVVAHAWVLDPASATANVAERLSERGASGDIAVEGGQTLRVGLDGEMVIESDLRIVVTNPGPPVLLLEQTVRGESAGTVVFSGEVAIPRNWSEDQLTVTERLTLDDAVPDPVPWALGRTWIDDTVGLVVTCTADLLEVEGRGTKLAWTFHPEGWTPPVAPEESTEGETAEDTPAS